MVLLEAVALDLALGAMLGSDAASLADSGILPRGCPDGAREGDRDELSFGCSLSNPFLRDSCMTRVENEAGWMVEESGKELQQDYYDVPCSTRGGL